MCILGQLLLVGCVIQELAELRSVVYVKLDEPAQLIWILSQKLNVFRHSNVTSVTSPLIGTCPSLTALTLSTSPKLLPRTRRVPTAGSSILIKSVS